MEYIVSSVKELVLQRVKTDDETECISTILSLKLVPSITALCLTTQPSVIKSPASVRVIVAGEALAYIKLAVVDGS